MPRHKKKKRAAASVKKTDWIAGDLVVAKLRGHRPWPAQIQKPEDYGYDPRPHRIFVTFFGTEETCFCSYNKITPFTGAVRKNLAEQLQKINTNPELERAIKEIFAADDELKISSKSHGSNQKEDEEMTSEKSEEEEPPVEPRSRKRGRVVEETVAPPVSVVDERPAKQEKTVKSMAAEQVQKLPRKVRIKVSTQASDLGSTQPQQGGDKAGVSSSHTRQSEPADSAKMPFKNGGRTTPVGKADGSVGDDSSVHLKEGSENVIVEVEETVRHDATENGSGGARGKAQEDSLAKGSAVASKTDSDVVVGETMELEDEKVLIESKKKTTSEDPIGKKGDAEKPLVSKTSEPAIEKAADDSSTIKESVTSETAEDVVEKMEVDKSSPPSKTSEPSTGKNADSSTAKVPIVTSETDIVAKMEVVKKESAIEEEKKSVKGDGHIVKEEESTIVSTNEQQEKQSSVAKAREDPHTVEDMETSRAGRDEGVSPVAKDSVLDTSKGERESGVELERAEDAKQNKVASASTKEDALDGATPRDPVSAAISASTKEEDTKEQKDGVPEAQQVSTVSTNDDAVSRAYLIDVVDPEESSTKPTKAGEQVHGSEAVASTLNIQVGAAVKKTEDQSVAVKKTENENDGAMQKVENKDEEHVKMAEDEDAALKKVQEKDGGVNQTEGQDAVVKKVEERGSADVKKTEDHEVDVKKTEVKKVEVKKTEEQDGKVTKPEGQDVVMRETEEHTAEMKKTEEQDAARELKKVEDVEMKDRDEHAAEMKKTEQQDATAELKKVELKKTEEQDATAELKKIEEQDTMAKPVEDKDASVKKTEVKDGVVNVTEMSTQAALPTKGDVLQTSTEKTLASTTLSAKPEQGDTPKVDIEAKTEVPAKVAKQEVDTARTGTEKKVEVSTPAAKQVGDTPQLVVEAEKKVEVSTLAAKQDAAAESKEHPASAS